MRVHTRICNKKSNKGKHALKSTIQSVTFRAESRQCANEDSFIVKMITLILIKYTSPANLSYILAEIRYNN